MDPPKRLLAFAAVLAAAFVFSAAGMGTGLQCFVEGECRDSQMLDFSKVNNSQECLKRCQSVTGCEWFTFYDETKTCTSLTGCINLNGEKCSDCISAEEECPHFKCGLVGKCFGALEGIRKTESVMECMVTCQNREECEWYVFDKAASTCTLSNDCPALDKSCQTCKAYQKGCPEPHDEL